MDGLTQYCVSLHEADDDRFTTVFHCWAEDENHAIEQAENAYPDGEIINVAEENHA